MEISWTDRVRSGEVLHRVKEERNILHNHKGEGWQDWSYRACELSSKTRY